jgi:RimJ/RimL family protein N-acetyltransferase
MHIRRLVPADAPAYRKLMLVAYARHQEAFTSTVEERAGLPLSWWESRLSAGDAAAEQVLGVFADTDERLAGVVGLAFPPRIRERHKATLFGMYVGEDFRRLGFARALVDAALAHARARPGVRLVQLTVTDGNIAAQSLYAACGFVPFGIEPLAVAVGDRFIAKTHMWCDLRGDS